MNLLSNTTKILALAIASYGVNVAHAECELIFPASTPSTDFVVHDDGTVTHASTELMWKVCPEGADWVSGETCSGEAGVYTWQESLQQVETVNTAGGYAGYTDWRLPNIKELQSIVEDQCRDPAVNGSLFNVGDLELTFGSFWSSTPSITNSGYGPDRAYHIDFRSGSSSAMPRDFSGQVRLVRNTQ